MACPSGPLTIRGEASGAVRVRDASLAVSFTHPSVVRAGQEYDLGITLFNSGTRDILGAYADLSPEPDHWRRFGQCGTRQPAEFPDYAETR